MLEYALEMARKSDSNGRVTVYAVCVDKRGRILGEATNDYLCTHPIQARTAKRIGRPEKECVHAELLSIVRATKTRRAIHTIYVARVHKDGSSAPAKPCPICAYLIEETGIKNVVHT